MAAVSVREVHNSRAGSINDRGEVEYTRTFQVITDSYLNGPATVRVATGVPRRYDIYADADGTLDTSAVCRSVEVSAGPDPLVWFVSCKYSSKVAEPDQGEENPLNRPADVNWTNVKFTTVATEDRDGEAIMNSAEEPYDPPLEKELIRLGLKISRNEEFYNAAVQLLFHNTVNSDAWFGLHPGQAKCAGISADRKYENGAYYWRVVYEFELMPAADATEALTVWAKRVLDQGWYELDGTTKKLIVDKFGKPVTAPHLLDGDGAKLVSGEDPVFNTFHLYETRAFGALNLP